MGVDARMFVRVPRRVSAGELKDWSYRLGSMARGDLFLGYGQEVLHRPLERISVYEQDGDDIAPRAGETFLEVPLSGRYYGPGYERGPLLIYIGIAEFLETLIPQCEVWYGGDSSGICAQRFCALKRQEFLSHAAAVSKDPYVGGFGSLDAAHLPSCHVCDVSMPQCGWGGNGSYALFRCTACGWEVEHRDGKTRQGFDVQRERAAVIATA